MATLVGKGAARSGVGAAAGDAAASGLPKTILAANTSAFALAFAAWVMFGPSARVIAEQLAISPASATLLKSVPILLGSIIRIPVGILTDRVGARAVFPALMIVSAVAACGLSWASSYGELVVGGLVLGLVGTTFAVGVQSVSSWTPKSAQGLALGIFGAGNVGTAITTFGLPVLMASIGWRGAFRVYGVVLALGALGYWLVVRDAPRAGERPTFASLLEPLGSGRTWCFGLYYTATFGVFVAATLTVGDIYIEAYKVPMQTAGLLATTFTFTASLARIPGGSLADRFGARAVMKAALMLVVLALSPIAMGLPIASTVALAFIGGLAMGAGMAATFKYIPQTFPTSVGAVGGVVGALGGLGGFFLPLVGAAVKSWAGSVYSQILPLVVVAAVATVVARLVEKKPVEKSSAEPTLSPA
ncbi:MAG TPA: MFS transporter [Candidatus Binatia bacterium]|nr:MFS transporter [Candidatus Binatia bacterium]